MPTPQNAASRAALLEADVSSLESSVQKLRAHRRSDASRLGQLSGDLTELLAKAQDRENTYAHLLDEVSARDPSSVPGLIPRHRRHVWLSAASRRLT